VSTKCSFKKDVQSSNCHIGTSKRDEDSKSILAIIKEYEGWIAWII
jgi:hypothetical protein